MPTPEIPHITTHNNTLLELAAGSADEVVAYYMDWRKDAAAVADAYRVWVRAPAAQASAHFVAYMAALTEEEAAATRYAMAVKNLDRAFSAVG
jgi:hypothetical protein